MTEGAGATAAPAKAEPAYNPDLDLDKLQAEKEEVIQELVKQLGDGKRKVDEMK